MITINKNKWVPGALGLFASWGFGLTAVANDYAIEEILVTAQKRAESIQDVPVSISAFASEFMNQGAINDIDDIIAFAPGLTGASTGTVANWAVRGITSSDYTAGSEPSVATYIDDAYIGRNVLASSAFFDVERVEVVRGPQGTLFGRNAAAGAIAVYTNKPDDENSLSIRLGAGNEDQRNVELIGNVRVSDNLFVRGGFFQRERNTGQEERNFDEDRFDNSEGYRVSALWDVSDVLSVRLTHQRADFDTRIGMFHTPDLTGDSPHASSIAHDYPHQDKSETYGTNLAVTWEINDNLTLTSISDTRRYDFAFSQDIDGVGFALLSEADLFIGVDTTPVFGVAYQTEQDQESYSQEFRLNGTSENVDWFAGLSWFEEDIRETQGLGYNQAGTSIIPGYLMDSNKTVGEFTALAVYGDVAWSITEAVKATVGARWTQDKKDWCANAVGFTWNDTQGQALCADESWSSFSPRVVIDWAISDDLLVYLNTAKGYKARGANSTPENVSGAFNPASFAPVGELVTFVKPEEVQAYEIGLKTTLRDGALQLNAAVYRNDYEQIQVLDVVNLVQVLRNAEQVEVDGIEVDFAYQPPIKGLQIRGNVTWMDAKFTDAVVNGVQLKGRNLKLAPENTASLSASYDMSVDTGTVSLFLAYNWQDEQFWDIQNTVTQEAYGLWSGQLSYTHASEKWKLALAGTNLTDKDYSNAIINFGTGLGDIFVKGLPQMVNLEFSYYLK
jgi:iron complex outermembrane receptor protein